MAMARFVDVVFVISMCTCSYYCTSDRPNDNSDSIDAVRFERSLHCPEYTLRP
jgi:hypothetical protein